MTAATLAYRRLLRAGLGCLAAALAVAPPAVAAPSWMAEQTVTGASVADLKVASGGEGTVVAV